MRVKGVNDAGLHESIEAVFHRVTDLTIQVGREYR